MLDDLYQEHILDHWECPHHRGSCQRATHVGEDTNPFCGDSVRIELEIDPDGTVVEAFFEGQGCCVSQAAASMLVEYVEGLSLAEARGFGALDMLRLFGPTMTPIRQRCCLLPWRVLQAILTAPLSAAIVIPSTVEARGCAHGVPAEVRT